MAQVYKLVFAGPVGAGKTTAIQTLSDIEVVSTDAHASDEVRLLKKTTTVAMDYGLMKLASGDQVRLYGTPGQQRFDFMWEILSENALGLVLMLKASAQNLTNKETFTCYDSSNCWIGRDRTVQVGASYTF